MKSLLTLSSMAAVCLGALSLGGCISVTREEPERTTTTTVTESSRTVAEPEVTTVRRTVY